MAEFIGATYEEAVAEAEKHFNADRGALAIQTIAKAEKGKGQWRIAAERTHIDASAATAKAQAREEVVLDEPFYPDDGGRVKLYYTEEGVMIESAPSIRDIELVSYIRRRGVRDSDMTRAKKQLESGISPALLAPAQSEGPAAPDEIYVDFSKDDMTATLYLFPGDADGNRISEQDITAVLTGPYRIVCGIDERMVHRVAAERPFRQPVVIARGKHPVEGSDAKVEYHFRLTTSMRPKLLEGDRVDYRTLDLFESARAGQVLATRTPPTAGTDGSTLRGRQLRARAGRDRQLPRGKGIVISEDKCTLTAAIDGMVSFKDGQITIMSRYVVEGNADMSVGNIDFVGDVEVRGNVIAGMTVKAEGSVEVHGVVEAATIIAGGSVVLRQGMQGVGKGEVRAGGDVMAKYFERVKVTAGGVVTADAIYHSEVSAVEAVALAGKRASLIGGITRSARQVSARTIGSTSDPATVVEVGILPEQRERLVFLENEVLRLNNEKGKMALLVKTYGTAPKENEPPEREALRQRVIEANRQLIAQLTTATVERDRIKAEMELVTGGRVHVPGTTFPGTRIVIGSSSYMVETPIDFATFRVMDGEVGFVACEMT